MTLDAVCVDLILYYLPRGIVQKLNLCKYQQKLTIACIILTLTQFSDLYAYFSN